MHLVGVFAFVSETPSVYNLRGIKRVSTRYFHDVIQGVDKRQFTQKRPDTGKFIISYLVE